ncbi:hypothetical protein [Rhodoferax ferrireducens]|uniref:hypothetical protein n=1 Tax=Rhodoferax ferrireducens TaxID=192843 RepID=UPI000E0D253F|nr:hypothetical protein [Rhodoferax ferrireducens]
MLKEVGASGQISLGKKYAGQLFEVDIQPDGSIIMRPMKVVPAGRQAAGEWAQANTAQIDQYNAWATQREPYSQRVRRWREQGDQGEANPR